MSLRRPSVAFLAVVLVAAGALSVWWYWVPLHRHGRVAADKRLFASLPVAPGLRERTHGVQGVKEKDSCDGSMTAACLSGPHRTAGYAYGVDYAIPTQTSAHRVLVWYSRHLAGWSESSLFRYNRRRDRIWFEVPKPRVVRILVEARH